MFLTSVVVWMPQTPIWLMLLLVVGAGVSLAWNGHMRLGIGFLAISLVLTICRQSPFWWPNIITHILGIGAFWFIKMNVVAAVMAAVVCSFRISDVVEALYRLRIPKSIILPLSVLFRFFPVAISQLRSVWRAMNIRGFTGIELLRHPFLSAERVAVPSLAAAARSSDDLAASGMLRGLGTAAAPTFIADLRFRLLDATLLVLMVIMSIIVGGIV